MAEHRGRVRAVTLGVGAAFDFLAGNKPQAPAWMQRLGLEWGFRLWHEPRRLSRRYLINNPRFAALALAEFCARRPAACSPAGKTADAISICGQHALSNSLASGFRRKRFEFFHSLVAQLDRPVSILDVGGAPGYWSVLGPEACHGLRITLLNLEPTPALPPGLTQVTGDARSLQFADCSFDVVFSNSVIEHLQRGQEQAAMAREVMRVGKRYFIQTPNKWFPLEPHFLFPMFQFLPIGVRVWLLQHFQLGWFHKTPDRRAAEAIVRGIHLLGRRELLSLFPGACLFKESALGVGKSYVAYGGWGRNNR